MKKETNNELLDDVLAEAAPADFREALLGETLHVFRRRRRVRQARNTMVIFALFALLSVSIWHKKAVQPSMAIAPSAQPAVRKSYTVVDTQPLAASAIVTTHAFGTGQSTSNAATVEIVETTTGNFHTVNDDQLLALVAAHPA